MTRKRKRPRGRFRTLMENGKWLLLPGEAVPRIVPPPDPQPLDMEGSRLEALLKKWNLGSPHYRKQTILDELLKESQRRVAVIVLRCQGVSYRDIAARMGVKHGSIQSIEKLTMLAIGKRLRGESQHGWTPGKNENRVSEELRGEARKLRSSGLSIPAIATHLNVSKSTVSRYTRLETDRLASTRKMRGSKRKS